MATKWGIVSAGSISHDFCSAVRSLPSEEHLIVAIAARDIEKAKAFALTHNIPKAYGSYEELAKDKNVDVVYIGSVSIQHFPLAKLMLEAKKPVLVEKPLTINLKHTKQLAQIAKENQCFLMEALWSRFFPAYKQLKEELEKKTIGDIMHVNASFGVQALDTAHVTKKSLGGGTLLAIGIYTVNAICIVFEGEKPQKIVAVGHLNDQGTDTGTSVSLLYSKGRMASISSSSLVDLSNELIISGSKGQLKLLNPMWCATKLVTPNKTYEFPLPDTVLPCNYVNSSGLRYEAMEVREYLKKGLLESPLMKHSDSELLAYIMDEIHRQIGVDYPDYA